MNKRWTKCLAAFFAVSLASTSLNLTVFATEIKAETKTTYETTDLKRTITVQKNGSAGAEKGKYGFSLKQSDFQLTGLLFHTEKEYKITVTGLQPGDPLPSIAFSQNMQRFGENIVNYAKLNNGTYSEDKTSITKTVKAPDDSYPGAIYVVNPYTEQQQKGNVQVTIETNDGSALVPYPVYNNSENSTIPKTSFKEFQQQLKDYKELMDFSETIECPQYVDIASDRILISTSLDAAYDLYVNGKDDAGKAYKDDIDEVLQTYGDSLYSMYQYAGIAKEDYPKMRQQVRALGKNAPFFAANGYIGFDAGAPEHYSYEILKLSFIKGWAVQHELGHVVENNSIRFLETTNNLYVLNHLVNDFGRTSRLQDENRYGRFFSTLSSQKNNVAFFLSEDEAGNANYKLDQISIWDRLVMFDQLNQYCRIHYGDKKDFWTEVTTAARESKLSGYRVNDALNKIVLFAADKFNLDIRPMFGYSMLDARFDLFETEDTKNDVNTNAKTKELIEKLNSGTLDKVPYTVRYIDDTYQANASKKLAKDATAKITDIKSAGKANKISMELVNGNVDDLLGYEIYRTIKSTKLNETRDLIGYVKASKNGKVTFSDTLDVSSYSFDYYVVPVSKDLSKAKMSAKNTTNGKETPEGPVEITNTAYDSFADELVVKGTGYAPTSANGNNNYIRLDIQYDGIEGDHYFDTLSYKDHDKNESVHFIQGKDNTWEMRITHFSEQTTPKGSEVAVQEFEVTAHYVEHVKKETTEVGVYEDTFPAIHTSQNYAYNIGDITDAANSSSLIKDIKVEGIKGNVEAKFDPKNPEYLGELQYVKTSLSEIDPKKDVFDVENGSTVLKLVPELADIHATYETYLTPYNTAEDGTIKDTLNTTMKSKQSEGILNLTTTRLKTNKWLLEIIVKDEEGNKTTYKMDIYSPNENARLYEFKLTNELTGENGNVTASSTLSIKNTDQFHGNDIYVEQSESSIDIKKRPVTMKGTPVDKDATMQYYHLALTGNKDVIEKPDGGLNTEEFYNGADGIKAAVTAADGVTVKEYSFVTALSDAAKATAEVEDFELSSNISQNGYVKKREAVENQNYDEIIYIASEMSDSDVERDLQISPIIKYLTSGEVTSKATWTLYTDDSFTQTKVLKDEGIKVSGPSIMMAAPSFKAYHQDAAQRLVLSVTSADGKHTKKYLIYSVESERTPLLKVQNFTSPNAIIAIYNWEKYVNGNIHEAATDKTITTDVKHYIYEPNPNFTGEEYTFDVSTYLADNAVEEVYQIVNGKSTPVIKKDGDFAISVDATDFTYAVKSADGTKTYEYRFTKARSNDTALKDLSGNGYMLHLDENGNYVTGFDPNVTEYFMLTNDMSKNIDISAGLNDEKAENVITVDGKNIADTSAVKVVKYARPRSLAAVQENNQKTGETKTVEVSVTAENQSNKIYTITVSDQFDFLDADAFANQDNKTELQAEISRAVQLLEKGNYEAGLYADVQNAIAKANVLVKKDFIEMKAFNDAIKYLQTAEAEYSKILNTDYVELYEAMLPIADVEDKTILRSATKLREATSQYASNDYYNGKKPLLDSNGDVLEGYTVMRNTGTNATNWHIVKNNTKLVLYIGSNNKPTLKYASNKVTEIGEFAFSDSSVTYLDWLINNTGSGVTKIDYAAFEGSMLGNGNGSGIANLKYVEVQNRAFWNTKLSIDTKNSQEQAETNNRSIPTDKVWVTEIQEDGTTLLKGTTILPKTTLTLPDDVDEVAAYAFQSMTAANKITEVKIPYQVKEIGQGAFKGNAELKVQFNGNNIDVASAFDAGVKVLGMDTVSYFNVDLSCINENGEPITINGLTGVQTYLQGAQVALKAPMTSGTYQFVGWKEAGKDDYISKQEDLAFVAKKNRTLQAVYELITYKLHVGFDAAMGDIQQNNTAVDASGDFTVNDITKNVDLHATAKEGYQFVGWYMSGRLVSNQADYAFQPYGDSKLDAKFAKKDTFIVTFKDTDDRIISVQNIEQGKAATAPENVSKPGYTFTGWNKQFTNVQEDMVVVTIWEKEAQKYHIEVENGKILNSSNDASGDYTFGTIVRVVADTPARGLKFAHWENEEGAIVSYDSEYAFGAVASSKLRAVYAQSVEAKPLISMNDVNMDEKVHKLSYIAQISIPKGYEKVECGVIIYKNGELKGNLTMDTAGKMKAKSPAQNVLGQYSITTPTLTAGTKVYARAYLIYKDVKTNQTYTIYSSQNETVMK